jgi:nitrous oxidase accessory protein NosD
MINHYFGIIEVACGEVLYVNTTGSDGAYVKIQDAINASSEGDIVYVYNGTYNENVVVNKTINLTGENRDTTIIQGGLGDVIRITTDWVNITGFTFRSGGWSIGDAGCELDNVRNCMVFNNNAIYNVQWE